MPKILDAFEVDASTTLIQAPIGTVGSSASHLVFTNRTSSQSIFGIRLNSANQVAFDSYNGSIWKQTLTLKTVEQEFIFESLVNSSNTTSGAVQLLGGMGIAGNLYIGGSVVINTDLTVNGTVTTINSTELSVADRVIRTNVSVGPDAPVPTYPVGIASERGDVSAVKRDRAGWTWDEGNSRWRASFLQNTYDTTYGTDLDIQVKKLFATGLVTTVASATGSAGLTLPHGTAPTAPVDGDVWTTSTSLYARINGTTYDIVNGGTTALTATYVGFGSGSNLLSGSANLTYSETLATGGLTIANTTASSSVSTGALVVSGGIGISGNMYAGGEISVTGAYRFLQTTKSVVGDNASASAIVAVALGGGSTVNKAPSATDIAAIAIGGSESGTNGSRAFGLSSIAIGGGDSTNNGAYAESSYSIAIGSASHAGSNPSSPGSIAIGRNSNVTTGGSGGGVAIGTNANNTSNGEGICIGYFSAVSGVYAVAIGRQSSATQLGSIGLGAFSSSTHIQGVAIGNNAATTKANQIVLGNATNHTEIYIPNTTTSTSSTTGALVIGGGIGAAGAIYAAGIINNFGSASTIPVTFAVGGGVDAPINATLRSLSNPADSQAGAGIFGRAVATSTNGKSQYGVVGLSTVAFGKKCDDAIGVYGRAEVPTTSHTAVATGLEGYATSACNISTNTVHGVRATAVSTASATAPNVFGGKFTATGAATSQIAYGIYATASGAITNYAGYFDAGLVKIASTAASTDTVTGALVVSGGVGIAGNLNVGGELKISGFIIIGIASVSASGSITKTKTVFTGTTPSQTLTLPAGSDGIDCWIRNASSVSVTIASSGANKIENKTTFQLNPNESIGLCFINNDWTIF